MRTEVISSWITDHARKIGALRENQKFTVKKAEVQEETTIVEGCISIEDAEENSNEDCE